MKGQDVIQEVADKHDTTAKDILFHSRFHSISQARQEACFRLRCELGWSYPRIGKFIGRDHSTIITAVRCHSKRHGVPITMPAPANTSPVPDGFKERALSNGRHATMAHFGIGRTTFRRMCVDAGIWDQIRQRDTNATRRIAMPDDFPSIANLTNAKIREIHPHLKDGVIAKMRKAVGVQIKTVGRPFAKGKAGGGWIRQNTGTKAPEIDYRDNGLAGQAQRHLQRHMAVVKASVIRKGAEGYYVGGRVMPAEEMIAFAERKG